MTSACVPSVVRYVCCLFSLLVCDGLLDVSFVFCVGATFCIVFVVDKMHTVTSATTECLYRGNLEPFVLSLCTRCNLASFTKGQKCD